MSFWYAPSDPISQSESSSDGRSAASFCLTFGLVLHLLQPNGANSINQSTQKQLHEAQNAELSSLDMFQLSFYPSLN